jgi:predicted dienelactone hydrolase
MTRCCLNLCAAMMMLLAFVKTSLAAPPVGEMHRETSEPSAAVRDATHRPTLRITVWYPAAAGARTESIDIGPPGNPFFLVGAVAPDAPFAADPPGQRRPVILLSHGFGGSARIMGWFGIPMAESGYVVIAVDHPGNNGLDPMTVAGGILWTERAEDLKRALAAVGSDRVIGPHLDLDRVGASGFSAGGFTALVLGGARADMGRFRTFCQAHPDDGVCRPQLEFPITEADTDKALQNPQIAALKPLASNDHSLGSVKAVFAMAPAIVQAMDPASLGHLHPPVTIVAGTLDTVVPPDTNARVAARFVPGARLEMVPNVGHYAFLSICTPQGMANLKICQIAGDSKTAHGIAIDEARALFARTLGTP